MKIFRSFFAVGVLLSVAACGVAPATAGISLADVTPLAGITCKNANGVMQCAKNGKPDPSLWAGVVQPWLFKEGYPKEFVTSKHKPELGGYRQFENFYDRTVFESDWSKTGKSCQTLWIRSNLKQLDRAKMIYCQLWGQGIEISQPPVRFISREEHYKLRKAYWEQRKLGN